MNNSITFYKRKMEWNITPGSITKTYDFISSGSIACLNIQGSIIQPISDLEHVMVNSIFDKYQILYSKILEDIQKLSSEIWSFEFQCYFEWRKKCNSSQDYMHYSVSILFMGKAIDYISVHSIDDVKKKLLSLKQCYYKMDKIPSYEYNMNHMTFPIIFHNAAAAALAHEVLGHIFEADNYYRYGYADIIDLLYPLQICIVDDPLINNSPGYYLEDDMGITARRTIVYNNNTLNTLIGCYNSNQTICNSLRRENYDKSCFPRMSNLIVTPTKPLDMLDSRQYIQIAKLSKCYIYHARKTVEFNIDFSFLHDDMIDIPLQPFKLKYQIDDLLSRLSIVNGGDMDLRPIQCAKHNQIINCGASSPDWMVRYE